MENKIGTIGFILAVSLYTLYILMFILRMLGKPQLGHQIASIQFIAILPLLYLLFTGLKQEHPMIYYIQLGLMLLFMLVEFLLDYLFNVDFRQTRWMVITYVTFFFAATGGLLGIVALARNHLWSIISIILFLVMGGLAFISRALTGI
jgi:hypothetical protein